MTTTLKAIRAHSPCSDGWAKLLKHLNKTHSDDEPLSLLTVLESNGLDDAVWCLRTEPTPERIRRFALAVARRVEHLNTEAKACNDITERYLIRQATEAELRDARYAAAYAAKAAYAVDDIASREAAYAAKYAALAAVHPADAFRYTSHTIDIAEAAAAYHAANKDANAAYEAEYKAQTQLFKEIFAELQTVTH
jgi:hypothetical protein